MGAHKKGEPQVDGGGGTEHEKQRELSDHIRGLASLCWDVPWVA